MKSRNENNGEKKWGWGSRFFSAQSLSKRKRREEEKRKGKRHGAREKKYFSPIFTRTTEIWLFLSKGYKVVELLTKPPSFFLFRSFCRSHLRLFLFPFSFFLSDFFSFKSFFKKIITIITNVSFIAIFVRGNRIFFFCFPLFISSRNWVVCVYAIFTPNQWSDLSMETLWQ